MKLYELTTTVVVAVALIVIVAQFFKGDEHDACMGVVVFGKNMQINCDPSISDKEDKSKTRIEVD